MRARPALGTLPRPARRHVAFLGGPGARFAECPPPPELAPWVAVLWRIKAPVGFELRISPDGCMDLIRDDVIGSFSRPATVTFRPGDVAEGVRFHPGGFPALFGVPASELVDRRVPIREIAPRYRSLRHLAAAAAPPDPLVRATYPARDLRALSRDSGYGERQIRRRVASRPRGGAPWTSSSSPVSA